MRTPTVWNVESSEGKEFGLHLDRPPQEPTGPTDASLGAVEPGWEGIFLIHHPSASASFNSWVHPGSE